jgi:hypothetical protein
MATDEDCAKCEFNKTIMQSQRGVLLIYGTTLLFLMWVIQTYLGAVYKFTPDSTIPLIFGAAVGGGWAFYFYAKKTEDDAIVEAKKKVMMKTS